MCLKELKNAIADDEAKGDVFEVTSKIDKSKTPIFAPSPAATPVGIVSYEVCWTPENFSGWETSRKPKIIPIKESACDELL